MPPKKAAAGPSKKTEQKKKEKIIEDKTFGLKNKKGSKQQKFIQQVQKQVQSGGHHPRAQDGDKRKEEKEKKLAEQREMALIFKPVQTQKVEKGTDPKSVVCAFFKQGTCTKGDKCKFSHDLTIENKMEKRSIYVDMRDDDDDMQNWDEAKLKEVVDKKHSGEKRRPTTDIICKYFLEAVEKSKYGWFWECPNGEKCIYRHALPQGYVLKKDKNKVDKPTEISLVDLIEKERAALGASQTRVTLETFLAWKKRKIQEKKDKLAAEEERKKNDFSKGKQFGISGREMFSFNPDLVDDGPMEDGDAAFDSYKRDEDDDEDSQEFKELDLTALSFVAQEVDGTGTVASTSRLKDIADEVAKNEAEEAANEAASNEAATADAAPINMELFMGLADEMNDLDLDDDDDDDDDDNDDDDDDEDVDQ